MSYRSQAESKQDLYFDHLGARQLSSGFEIWLSLRSASGEMVRIASTFNQGDVVPSVSDLWGGAAWCEREAAEAFSITFDVETPLLLLADEHARGYLRKENHLVARDEQWPGSFDPAGKTMRPLGAE